MTRLSNRQFPMLKAFADRSYMSVESAQLYDQRAFRSMLVRGWITYHAKRGFQITELRLVIGSVAHLERRCCCYVPGSTEDDPPHMTPRQAARAALVLYNAVQARN